ncbi:MotE family protein [Aliiruegeria lutimaris]|uniref:Flagellar motility protein MotE, a chaperone for MotC folding n=1 Tax=Aliiruegeria lutimaris TaxID=571298 RepID=A0A1G8NP55_9RHOB|nr:hypothetical protein [Aliiruegeria lutimaris]SDI81897.1 Flagellar motility protein MotE, a chaperone for MotC folding [Aliiruegeria lutimaris]
MKRKDRRKTRSGRGALVTIGALFLISGMIRLADGTGAAIASEVEALSASSSAPSIDLADANDTPECVTNEGVNQVTARLRERRAQLDEREEKIARRMAELEEAEMSLQTNLETVKAAEEALRATISLADGAADRDIETLIAVYEKMKPRDVSVVFEAMDPSFAAGFLARMRPESAASVMAGLSAQKAYTVSILLAGRNMDVPQN